MAGLGRLLRLPRRRSMPGRVAWRHCTPGPGRTGKGKLLRVGLSISLDGHVKSMRKCSVKSSFYFSKSGNLSLVRLSLMICLGGRQKMYFLNYFFFSGSAASTTLPFATCPRPSASPRRGETAGISCDSPPRSGRRPRRGRGLTTTATGKEKMG